MGNCLSKTPMKDEEEMDSMAVTHARIVTQGVQSPSTQEPKSQATNERSPTYQVTLDGSIYFFETVRQISEATELLAPLKAVCGVIVKALETARAVHANKDEWGRLVDEIQTMRDTIVDQIHRLQKNEKRSHSLLLTDPAVVEPLKRFATSLGEIFEASSDALNQSNKGSNPLNRLLTVRVDAEKIQQYKEAVNKSFDQFTLAINLFTAHCTKETKEQGDITAIRSLKIVNNPGGNQHQTCTEHTRVHLLHEIRTWAGDLATDKQIFWIVDRAGTGKSTVAKQIVTEWEKAAKPVVPFFFSMAAVDTMSNARFCATVAVKLAGLADFGTFRTALAQVLRKDLTVETLSFEEQFEKLVLDPLQTSDRPLLLVIDALDECDERGRSELLLTLLSNLGRLRMIKVIITSRPSPDINRSLQNQEMVYSRRLQGGGDPHSTTQDILRHLNNVFLNSAKLRHLQHHVQELGTLANGLFIWASTAAKFLEKSLNVDKALAAIERMNGLDDLYTRIMECAIPKNDDISRDAVSFILQTILAAQRPLSISEMQKLNRGEDVQSVVEALGSVLSSGAEDNPVQILHPTFQEYLTDRSRSGIYFVDVNNGHKSLALGCLGALSENLKDPGIPMSEGSSELHLKSDKNQLLNCDVFDSNIPASAMTRVTAPLVSSTITYATTHWPNHAAAFLANANAQGEIEELEKAILCLFRNHLIQWFELVVLLQGVYLCIKNLAVLQGTVPVSASKTTDLTNTTNERVGWCRDGHRFLQYHQVGIEQGSIHVHRALAFTPKRSLTYQFYYNKYADRLPSVKSGISSDWPSHQVLSGHTREVYCVAFSPDGTRIVSGSGDSTLRLWDGVTGASIGNPMNGHTDSVNCVAFSPDGTRIISGSFDSTLRLWDGTTGANIGGPMEGHTDSVKCVLFSPDGTRVVSGSSDSTARLWNGITGASIGTPMKGHTRGVRCVAFSPDGTRVVSGSKDRTLRLWDGINGVSIGNSMKGHFSSVGCVAFSPDGTHIVSGSFDSTLRIWDGITGVNIGNSLNGHTNGVDCVAFSPDGTRIVSGSHDFTLRLWNSVTGASIGSVMRGHTGSIDCVTFSPDGTCVVSGSSDSTLRLWDSMTGTSSGNPMKGHTSYVNSVAFSPDGTRVVSGSQDSTVRLWDGVIGVSIGISTKGHTGSVSCVAFSPDGTRAVSGSYDSTLRLWDSVTGTSIGDKIKGHTDRVECLAFSPDGTRIVSGSEDRTLRLWDGTTGASIGIPMKGHTNSVPCVGFSPDGTRVVSGSLDSTIRLWNPSSCTQLAIINTGDFVSQVQFSICGSYIVSENRVWDISLCLPSLVENGSLISRIPFSPVRFNSRSRALEFSGSFNLFFLLSNYQVSEWAAYKGCIVLGSWDGRVMIVDCTHLL